MLVLILGAAEKMAGSNRTSHPQNGHDDISNAVAGVVVGLAKPLIERHFYFL